MLKAKNIIIIFILNYLILLLLSSFLEAVFIGSKAQEVQLLMRTAADMALEQVQATDDFFTTGGGYIMDTSTGTTLRTDVTPYQMKAPTISGVYKDFNMFEAVTGTNDIDQIFAKVYGNGKVQKFIQDNPNVLTVDFTAGYSYTETIGDGTSIDDQLLTMRTDWYKIPNLANMGVAITGSEIKTNSVFKMDGNLLADTEILNTLWTMYDLEKTAKEMDLNGTDIKYYLTPISLGVTYINEELLQAFFMNNLELLMRSKYSNRDGYNLNDELNGAGVFKGAFYSELTDTDSVKNLNPINNGSFTLLRGERLEGTDPEVTLYKGIMPKIEYVVIDSYDDGANDLLQQIYGAKFSKQSSNSMYADKPVTGSLLKSMNEEYINNMKSMTGTTKSSIYDHKPIVVAKVTFYANFVVPYSTPSIREMRGRVNSSNTVDARTLFDPFAYSQINIANIQPILGNMVDINSQTIMDGGSYSSVYNGVTRLGGNSDAVAYTTFFAITP